MNPAYPDRSTGNEHEARTSDLPLELAQPAWRALTGAGYWRLEQVATASAADLKRLHGIGPKAIGQLRSALAERGLSFAGE